MNIVSSPLLKESHHFSTCGLYTDVTFWPLQTYLSNVLDFLYINYTLTKLNLSLLNLSLMYILFNLLYII